MPDSPSAKIFIVDDDPGLLRLVEMSLKREGLVTATASSGKEAISWLAQNEVDLMILDLKLQDVEGKELIDNLASTGSSVPFLVITGQGDERAAVEMMKRGALEYLIKDAQFISFIPSVVHRALKQLEKDKRLVAAQVALKESQEQLLAISEREQRRFGEELHDGLGQQLTAIELRCQAMKADLPSNRTDLKKQISEISEFLREAVTQTRSLARGLSPVNLGSGGLMGALAGLASRMSTAGGIKCVLECPSPILMEDTPVESHLFRIAQEAVNNAVKHSEASRVVVRFTKNDRAVRLEIIDNGKGLPKKALLHQGLGLQIMKHRASVIGAELEFKSKSGTGVTVTCTLEAKKL